MHNNFQAYQKPNRLKDFANCIQHCNLCPRMEHRRKVLSELNGNINSKVLFIAEAPGRLGADKTGIPLYGDKTGDNFEKLLYSIGWNRNDIFITNAVLCNPRNSSGNNDTPNNNEIKNCSIYLNMTINLIQPQFIITLGRVALTALNFIYPHSYILNHSVAVPFSWNQFTLFPMYHPGPRALIHRSFEKQKSDYKLLTTLLVNGPLDVKKKGKNISETNSQFEFSDEIDRVKSLIIYFIKKLDNISFFKATKLLYLLDYKSISSFGFSFSGATYLRQVEGPWLPKLKDIVNTLNGNQISLYFLKNKPFIKKLNTDIELLEISTIQKQFLDDFLSEYGKLSDRGLKIAAYRTGPMQYILEKEKKNIKMLNKIVINKDKTILEIENAQNEMLLF